jgi:hypothetical protein
MTGFRSICHLRRLLVQAFGRPGGSAILLARAQAGVKFVFGQSPRL